MSAVHRPRSVTAGRRRNGLGQDDHVQKAGHQARLPRRSVKGAGRYQLPEELQPPAPDAEQVRVYWPGAAFDLVMVKVVPVAEVAVRA